MQHGDNTAPATAGEQALRHRREVITTWAFAAFLAAGAGVLGIYALMTYA